MRPPLNPSAWKWCAGAGTVLLALLTLHGGHCGTAPADFVAQYKAGCHFPDGSERVRFLDRYFYNQEEFVYFDSDVGRYVPKTEFGKTTADYWNNDQAFLEQKKAEVERVCKHNYDVRKQDARSWKEPDSSESAKSKRLTGIVGFVLGTIFITLGLIIYLKNKKGTPRIPVPQNDVA
uniref:MHC class II antigen beta chain n=1 Tax=Andrias davidianus TaxID=141262 RepID=U5QEB5_ANDDA|nr:MHC class II antigen beta chain [Andrias davidianus]